MKSNKKNYFIIIVYALLLVFLLLGSNNLYGSTTDWISQHIIIPDYLRSIFYETKNILPNLAFNIGAGQNIFNFSYYGLLSPIIMLSYFLPFLSMTAYIIIASIILYILSGILMYKFLNNNKFSNLSSLCLSLAFLTLGFTYHFHHHIMFVWNLPFIILSLIGVDKYVEKNKSGLLIFSTFLMIMINYYYSVPGLLCIIVYGIYKLLDKDKFKLKQFSMDVLKASLRIIIPVLMAGILLLPTANIILETGRTLKSGISYLSLLIPNLDEVTYKSFSMGLTGLMLISTIGLLCSQKKKRSDIFLSIFLLLITFIPFFMYLLNGFLYIRGKVLIPFSILYIFTTAKLIKYLKNNQLNLKAFGIAITGLIILILLINTDEKMIYIVIDILLAVLSCVLFERFKKELIVYIPLLGILLGNYYQINTGESYVSVEKYQDINSKNVTNLITKLPEDDFYRTYNLLYTLETSNKYYGPKYNGISMYSSNYNKYYGDFYNEKIANNIVSRNSFVMAGSNNELYYNFMGVKYVISKNDPGNLYEKIAEEGDIGLYYNKDAYPIVYATDSYGSIKEYEKLEFPYNLEYLMRFSTTDNLIYLDYQSNIKEADLKFQDSYEFEVNKTSKYSYELSKPIKDDYIIIKFNMAHHPSCEEGDNYITINGIKNKLTCNEWMYHNQNYEFEYVIPNPLVTKQLDVKITKGKYKIDNLKIYTYNYSPKAYTTLDNVEVNRSNSTITGMSNLVNDGYIMTSLPFDKGYKAYVDDKEVNIELVNEAFLGFKVSKGEHRIKIVYHSPWLIFGILVSLTGIVSSIMLLVYEKFSEKIKKLIKKNKEIIMYLIFGVLTTLVSIVSYYILTKTILNPLNSLELQVANVISWILAVTFAYVTNRKYVFSSKNKNILKEAVKFYESRILTLLLDMGLMFIFVSCLKYNDTLIKVIDQVLVIVANYILSKLIVFKKESGKK